LYSGGCYGVFCQGCPLKWSSVYLRL
jgi:hypothetical protein